MRAARRLIRAIGHLLAGLATLALVFPRLSREARELRVQAWSQRLLWCLGIRLDVRGRPCTSGPVLLVANHISWLDITALHAALFCRFISKADVKSWPLIGWLADGVGTLFIERNSRRDARRVVHQMTQRLLAGEVLAVFPEGTTSEGLALLPFHANLLQPAIAAPAPVQPVAIEYVDGRTGRIALEPCYVGDESLLESVWRTLRAPDIHARITFGEAHWAQGRDRRAWALDLQREIQALRRVQPGV